MRRIRPYEAYLPEVTEFATEVYERAFEDAHLEPSEAWRARLAEGGGDPEQHLVLAHHGGRVAGGMLLEIYPPGVGLVTYIVVRPELWDSGVGRELMREAQDIAGGLPLFAEMADPGRHAGDAHAVRRAKVLHAWGWRAVACRYLQPPLEEGGAWADDLLLLHHGDGEQVDAVDVEALTSGLRRSLPPAGDPGAVDHRWGPHTSDPTIPTLPLTVTLQGS